MPTTDNKPEPLPTPLPEPLMEKKMKERICAAIQKDDIRSVQMTLTSDGVLASVTLLLRPEVANA